MFKNARIYTFENDIDLNEDMLKEFVFTPCKAQQAESVGFVPLYNERYIHELGKRQLFKLKIELKYCSNPQDIFVYGRLFYILYSPILTHICYG